MVYAKSTEATGPLYAESVGLGFAAFPSGRDVVGLEPLAFRYALLATVRLAPILPAGEMAQAPFAVALLSIEQENGRQLQTQIRLLKGGYATSPLEVREAIIAQKAALVEDAFSRFLESLAT